MKYVNFNRLSIKNFLSVGEEPVVINFPSGLNIITGYNKDKSDRRNGVGKSTIADALYFAIYGTTIREIKKENVSNNVTSGKTEVSIEFTIKQDNSQIDYKITRLLNPSKCYIYKNGDDVTRDSINNTTKFVSDLISSSPDVFQNCVIMTINNTIPFMGKKKIDKRKFIEGILNLEVFSSMLTKCRSEYNDIQKDFNIECGKYEGVSSQIQSIETQKEKQNTDAVKRLKELKDRKKSNDNEIESLKAKSQIFIDKSVSDYKKIIEKLNVALEECLIKKDKIKSNIFDVKASNKTYTESIDKLSQTSGECPVCLQSISSHAKSKIEEEKLRLNEVITNNLDNIKSYEDKLQLAEELEKTLKSKINKTQEIINEQSIKLKEKDGFLSRMNQLEKWNDEILGDIKSIDTQVDVFDKMSTDLTNSLNEIQKSINQYKSKINLLDVVKFVVSEEGVKSYIVKKILQLLNSRLAYYLKKMDSNCVCVFNEYFEEQIIDDKGKVLSYFNFSGAEKKNIDLACLFAFMDVRRMQGDVAFNFNIYDELFDSSLDERGVELVIDILNERIEKYNECIMVISHRKESQKLATGEVIFLEKSSGVTTRVTPPEDI